MITKNSPSLRDVDDMKQEPRRIPTKRRRGKFDEDRDRIFHEKQRRLGNAVDSFLNSHGLTQEWYIGFKEKFGLPPTCDCPERKEWLNRTSEAHPTIANIGVKLLNALTRKT